MLLRAVTIDSFMLMHIGGGGGERERERGVNVGDKDVTKKGI
jgi:hypothetical protein